MSNCGHFASVHEGAEGAFKRQGAETGVMSVRSESSEYRGASRSEELTEQQMFTLTDYLRQFTTPERQAKIEAVLAQRTRYITVVLEDIHFEQNASAVLRNCDSFGIQDVHIIENTTGFKVNRHVTRGCNKWLTLHQYANPSRNTERCVTKLKHQGYRIVATTPHTDACFLQDLPLDQPIALMFGNEMEGLSTSALALADLAVCIPMMGFSESFNISVSTALCLQSVCDLIRYTPVNWSLTATEAAHLRLDWYRQSATASTQLERKFWREQ